MMIKNLFPVVTIGDSRMLLIETREEACSLQKQLPDGLYMYDVRHNDTGDPCSIEPKVVVNYFGSVITDTPIPGVVNDGSVLLETYEDVYDDDENLIDQEIAQNGLVFGYESEYDSVKHFFGRFFGLPSNVTAIPLTPEAYNALNSITSQTKTDCWFWLEEYPANPESTTLLFAVRDLEEDNLMDWGEALSQLGEGLEGQVSIEITNQEYEALKALYDNFGFNIPCFERAKT